MQLEYKNGSLTADELVKHLALTGELHEVARDLIWHREAIKEAENRGLEVSDEQVQEHADEYRRERGLHSAEDTMDYLDRFELTPDEFSDFCESTVTIGVLRQAIADDDQIKEYFVNNRSRFDRARVYSIVVESEPLANELIMQVEEDEENFMELAREHSVDESTKWAGGYLGELSRDAFTSEAAPKVFNAFPGDVVGPFEFQDHHQIFLVDEILEAELNDQVKQQIRQQLTEQWLNDRIGEEVKITS